MSRVLAFIVLLILFPVIIVVALLLLIIDGGVFFLQDRIGKDREVFRIVKFQTMKQGEVTAFGRILRNLGLDEMPQLLNVLKGEMVFVGPRPLTLFDIERLGWDSEYHNIRWQVKPGITGMAQLSPTCSKKHSWFYDRYYAKHKSLSLNMIIVVKTFLVAVFGKKKVRDWSK